MIPPVIVFDETLYLIFENFSNLDLSMGVDLELITLLSYLPCSSFWVLSSWSAGALITNYPVSKA